MLALQKFGQNLSFNWHRHRPSESSPSFEVPSIQPSIERAQIFRHPPIIDRDNRRAWPNSAMRVAAFFDQMPNISNLKMDNKYKVVFSIILFVGTFGTGCRGDHTFFKLAVQYFWWALTGEYQVFRCVFIRATISTTTCQQSLLTRVKGADYIRLHKYRRSRSWEIDDQYHVVENNILCLVHFYSILARVRQ